MDSLAARLATRILMNAYANARTQQGFSSADGLALSLSTVEAAVGGLHECRAPPLLPEWAVTERSAVQYKNKAMPIAERPIALQHKGMRAPGKPPNSTGATA